MKKFAIIPSIIILFILNSCQKEISSDILPASGGGSSTGDYQPTSAGSEWNYSSTSQGNHNLKSLGTDTIINGLKYYKFDISNASGAERAYYSKVNGVYKEYGELDPTLGSVEITRLKDSAVGVTWTNKITISGFSNYHKFIIAARNIQHTVNGKTYNNVIEVNYEFLVDDQLSGGMLSAGTGKNYYAKDVGAIESFFNVSALGVTNSDTTRLVSYTIR